MNKIPVSDCCGAPLIPHAYTTDTRCMNYGQHCEVVMVDDKPEDIVVFESFKS